MEIVRVNSEELENYPVENLIDKFVYNHFGHFSPIFYI